MNWNAPEIQSIVDSALREDKSHNDLTARYLIHPSWQIKAVIIAKQAGIICGLPLAQRILKALDPSIRFKPISRDGKKVKRGEKLALFSGQARSVLSGERPALNAIQHLSGIATFTHEQVQRLKGSGVRLFDTRKTLPGWRILQKYAVRCGGGYNHRMSLGDAILIKENHLDIARRAGADWVSRIEQAMKKRSYPLQMEIQTERDLQEALRLKPKLVLLDNLATRDLTRMMRIVRRAIPGVEIEFTGGIRPENLRALAKLHPDRISMGRLTHSTPAFDCSLDITHVYSR